ncbi:hypothetical protein [uncultured Ruegeria sp.]|uniref:hypothetical protein n=1 Tax=uncultured Ruegeria sp. TaxID=259304 RepID=UPI0026060A50|nr:hypothetical protein [uncultured Ruegeria sp.]
MSDQYVPALRRRFLEDMRIKGLRRGAKIGHSCETQQGSAIQNPLDLISLLAVA